jgi:peptide chain release factor 3
MATDIDDAAGVPVEKSSWEIGYVAERYPKVAFDRTRERG